MSGLCLYRFWCLECLCSRFGSYLLFYETALWTQNAKVKAKKVKHRSLFKVSWRNGFKNKLGLWCWGVGAVDTLWLVQDRLALLGVEFLAGLAVPKLSNCINLSAKIATLLFQHFFNFFFSVRHSDIHEGVLLEGEYCNCARGVSKQSV